ncbi:type III-A CRISPR-associated RAMP protein Csm5 [Peptococcus simiae]|uniref:type III-A CRISPR-associated RAMP protein Csm5 n=1 Tax=Peptococcus simiae TaxID=1643805 RepID=UPI00397ECEFB
MERMKRLGFLEVHELFLETGGPLYIAGGRPLDRRHWLGRPEGLALIDEGALGRQLLATGLLEAWQGHLAAGGSADAFLASHPDLGPAADLIKRVLPVDRGAAVHRVHPFLRNPAGRPYVPGTTLKGALRQVLLVYFLNEMPEVDKEGWRSRLRQAYTDGDRSAFSAGMQALQVDILHKLHLHTAEVASSLNDLMRAFSVSDSDPLGTGDTVAVRRRLVHREGVLNAPDIYEVPPPGTRIRFTLRIDIPLMNRGGLMLTVLNEALQLAQLMQERVFWEKIPTPDRAPVDLRDLYLYLGGGSGFVNKSLVYALFDDAEARDLTNALLAAEPTYDPALGQVVAPYMRPTILAEGLSYDWGKCRITIHY